MTNLAYTSPSRLACWTWSWINWPKPCFWL